jgi:hypothetical protein
MWGTKCYPLEKHSASVSISISEIGCSLSGHIFSRHLVFAYMVAFLIAFHRNNTVVEKIRVQASSLSDSLLEKPLIVYNL